MFTIHVKDAPDAINVFLDTLAASDTDAICVLLQQIDTAAKQFVSRITVGKLARLMQHTHMHSNLTLMRHTRGGNEGQEEGRLGSSSTPFGHPRSHLGAESYSGLRALVWQDSELGSSENLRALPNRASDGSRGPGGLDT
jgi:hypothetical protein